MNTSMRSMIAAATFSLAAGTFAFSSAAFADEANLSQFSPYTQGGGANAGSTAAAPQNAVALNDTFAPGENVEYAQGGGANVPAAQPQAQATETASLQGVFAPSVNAEYAQGGGVNNALSTTSQNNAGMDLAEVGLNGPSNG